MTPTPRPEDGVVSWNVNTTCNYRCTYCTQRFKDDRGRWATDTPRFLAAFARLPGRWEVKLSGGEPFVHPTLNELVRGLSDLGHHVSVVTNFSSTREKLLAFADAAQGRLAVFSCSLHLEYVDDVAAFAEKARWLQDELMRRATVASPHVNVTTVATGAALPRLDALAELFRAAGVTFKVQPEKQDRDVVPYDDRARALLLRHGGHNQTGEIEHRFEGRPCWSGARYFILDDLGEAFRCYPARRYKLERMGSFLDPSFRLDDEAKPCRYATCNCTVPIARGMMPRNEP